MAGSASDISLPNSSFFVIHNDAGPLARTVPAPALPGGRCNFHAGNGPPCGCRRFWSRAPSGQYSGTGSPTTPSGYAHGAATGNQADLAWCMCNHHACFHDDIQNGQAAPGIATTTLTTTAGQENERPRSNREPLTPVLPDLSFQMPLPAGQSMDFNTFNETSFSANLQTDFHIPTGESTIPVQEPSIPDTLSWTNFIQSQPGHQMSVLPTIPSQSLLPSQPSSTTSSTRMAYLKPFGGMGLNTLSGVNSKLREPLVVTAEDTEAHDEDTVDHSNEPSVDGLQTVTNTPRSTRRADIGGGRSPLTIGTSRQDFQELSNTVQGHEERLDRLETVSLSADHDDCHNQHDRTDLRVTELEVRVDELEKTLNNDGSSAAVSQQRSRRRGFDESAASIISVSTDASGRTERAEMYNELQALKAQLSHLQASSFPCYAQPLELEVVFFPFPLKGVWFESRDFPSQRLSSGTNVDIDQWTQLPNSSSTTEPQSPGYYEWAGPELESEWRLARACAPDKMIDRRLRSRGLIKNIAIRGPDARSVQQAVSAAFGTAFRTFSRMQANVHHGSAMHQRVNKFLGLQQPWVPLRKIHKDSRLRFLSPAEMITPTTWDVSFLTSSVVMKATGTYRLFITQPEAYLQDQDAYINGWNWQRVRELSRVYPDSQSSQDVPEADALEDCWAWDDRVDETSSQNSSLSLSLRQAAQPRLKSISPSQQQFYTSHTGRSPSLAASRSRAESPVVVLKEWKPSVSRPSHVRTASMPPALAPLISPLQGKRRIASATFGNIHPHSYERRPSPQLMRANTSTAHAIAMSKRRRSTRSPSVPLSARFRNTPRWSTSSPSPIPEAFAIVGPSSNAGGPCRQVTPLYYATPHSNAAPFTETRANHGAAEPDEDGGSGTDSYSNAEQGGVDSEDEDSQDYDGDSSMLDFGHPRRSPDSDDEDWAGAQHPLPEDEPWPGIEDEENRDPEVLAFDSVDVYVDEDAMSDVLGNNGGNGEGRTVEIQTSGDGDAQIPDDQMSQRSSVPSEYPSTQRAWTDGAEEFRVFEDEMGGVTR